MDDQLCHYRQVGLWKSRLLLSEPNHNTWPSWTNGPNGLSAAQLVVNYTNSGGYRQGTFAAITSLATNAANSGLAVFTNGSWMCWAYFDPPSINTDNGDMFLSTGNGFNDWLFGKYQQSGPQFSRTATSGGGEPLETYADWPSVATPQWNHYAMVWDGTNMIPYLNGVVYPDSGLWTNRGTFTLTNQYRNDTIYGPVWTNYSTDPASLYTNSSYGILVSTNPVIPAWSYVAVGVNSHGNMPVGDGGYAPNNMQMQGRLSDVRIYNRALSPAEIGAVYSGKPSGEAVAPPNHFRVLYSGH